MSKYLSLLSPGIKKSSTLAQAIKKIDFFGVHLGVLGGWYPQFMSKYCCLLNFYDTEKKTSALACGVKKVIFGASSQRMKLDTH